jgi:glucose/arabinose dehydrogenase
VVTPTSGGHFARDIAFANDGKQLLIAVGSQSNAAEEMPPKILADIAAWEIVHGAGAAWGDETGRADVLAYPMEDHGSPKALVTGISECTRLTVQPRTSTVWCTADERAGLGDGLVPDYSTRLSAGQFYGWPWYYIGNHEDPRHKGERPGLASRVAVPDVLYQPHSGASDLLFYTSMGGDSAFPRDYVGDAFAVLHGSTIGAARTGHKIVRVRMRNDAPTGEYEDFLTGFITDDRSAWGFPVSIAEAHDGSLLVSDDGANLIYRISYNNR